MRTEKYEWTKLGVVMLLWVSISIIGLSGYGRTENEMVDRINILDNFNDYAEDYDIDNDAKWTLVNDTASATATVVTFGGSKQLYMDVTDSSNLQALHTIQMATRTPTSTEIFKVKMKITVPTGEQARGGFYQTGLAFATANLYWRVTAGGSFEIYDGAWKTTNRTVTADTKTEIIFIFNSTTTYELRVGGLIATISGSNPSLRTAWSAALGVVFLYNPSGANNQFYIDDMFMAETSKGMQWTTFKQNGNDISGNYGIQGMAIELSDGSMLFQTDNGITRSSPNDPDDWTDVISSADYWSLVDLGSGTIYAALQTGVADTAGNIKYSTDYGENWTNVATTNLTNELRISHLFEIGDGDVYMLLLHITETPMEVEVWKFDTGLETWAVEDTFTCTNNNSDHPCFGGVSGDTMTCFKTDGTSIRYLKWDQTAGSFTSVSSTSGYKVPSTSPEFYYSLIEGTTIIQTVDTTGSSKRVLRSTDSGATFSEFLTGTMNFIRSDTHTSGNKQWAWNGLWTATEIYYYDNNVGHFIKIFDLEDEIDDFDRMFLMSDSGYLWLKNDDTDGEIWEYTGGVDTIKDCEIEGFGNEEYKSARWVVSPANKGLFAKGDVVEFYDGYDVLAFKGKVVDNQYIRGIGQQITAIPLKGELLEEPKDTVRSFTTSATDVIIETIVGAMDFLYDGGNIDYNGDFTITYTIDIKTPIKDYIKTARELERAVFFVTPAGEVQMYAHDQIPSTGLIWRDDTFKQIRLQESLEVDMRLTRSEVVGAYVQGTSDNVEVRRDYVGNSTLETSEGVVRISLSRPQLTNDTEVLQLATNRFNIYGGVTKFIKLLPITNQGFIQPGKTIDFSWSETNVTVAQGDYFVANWKYNLKFDRYSEFWLTDSIVTYNEWKAIRQTIGRDNQISETYIFGETETSADGVVCVQNPVNRLRAGTTVWRIPEPTDYDFDETDLDAIGNPSVLDTWYDLDLSSIIPEGVKSVLFKIIYEDNLVDSKIQFRKNGQSSAIQTSDAESIAGNGDYHVNLEVGVCNSRIMEFMSNIDIADWTDIRIVILAWRL
jgi:hypothetical protein